MRKLDSKTATGSELDELGLLFDVDRRGDTDDGMRRRILNVAVKFNRPPRVHEMSITTGPDGARVIVTKWEAILSKDLTYSERVAEMNAPAPPRSDGALAYCSALMATKGLTMKASSGGETVTGTVNRVAIFAPVGASPDAGLYMVTDAGERVSVASRDHVVWRTEGKPLDRHAVVGDGDVDGSSGRGGASGSWRQAALVAIATSPKASEPELFISAVAEFIRVIEEYRHVASGQTLTVTLHGIDKPQTWLENVRAVGLSELFATGFTLPEGVAVELRTDVPRPTPTRPRAAVGQRWRYVGIETSAGLVPGHVYTVTKVEPKCGEKTAQLETDPNDGLGAYYVRTIVDAEWRMSDEWTYVGEAEKPTRPLSTVEEASGKDFDTLTFMGIPAPRGESGTLPEIMRRQKRFAALRTGFASLWEAMNTPHGMRVSRASFLREVVALCPGDLDARGWLAAVVADTEGVGDAYLTSGLPKDHAAFIEACVRGGSPFQQRAERIAYLKALAAPRAIVGPWRGRWDAARSRARR